MNICRMTNSSFPQMLREEEELPSVFDTADSLARDVLGENQDANAKTIKQNLSKKNAILYGCSFTNSYIYISLHDEKLDLPKPCCDEIYKFQSIGQKIHKHTQLFPNTNL